MFAPTSSTSATARVRLTQLAQQITRKPSGNLTIGKTPLLTSARMVASSSSSTSWLRGTAQESVDAAIRDNKLVVFSKEWCPFCRKAKDTLQTILDSDTTKYKVLELESVDRRSLVAPLHLDDIQDYFKQLAGTRTVPKVFLEGKCLGGGDEMVSMARTGQLQALLKESGLLARNDAGEEQKSGNGGAGQVKAAAGGQNVRYFRNGAKVERPIEGLSAFAAASK
ncbi:unnamed protein product [Amoebophrya sp. A120]|nr:unnamed protein product [Amoebophrya sp. A120]|eukprot:GSA120T00017162001.1